MIFKTSLTVSGDRFYPSIIKDRIVGKHKVSYYWDPNDKKERNDKESYGFGLIALMHSNEFATDKHIIEYDEGLISILLNNFKLFKDSGADDFQCFIEVYHDGGQCNFEIFSKELLKSVSHISLSFPVSVYALDPSYFLEWSNEIENTWGNNK